MKARPPDRAMERAEKPAKDIEFKTTHRRDATIVMDRFEVERMIESHLRAEYGLGVFDNRRSLDFAFEISSREGHAPLLTGLSIKITEDLTKPIGPKK